MACKIGFSIVYRNEISIGTYLDIDLDLIWLKEWFVALDDSLFTCLAASENFSAWFAGEQVNCLKCILKLLG